MTNSLDSLFENDPIEWIRELPEYQRDSIETLISNGESFEEIAQIWINASAENTYRFSSSPVGENAAFLENIKREVRCFLCGDEKYEKERDGLFGEKGLVKVYVVSAMAVAIAPHLSVAAVAISPLIALVIASFGKITVNAWCASYHDDNSSSPPTIETD